MTGYPLSCVDIFKVSPLLELNSSFLLVELDFIPLISPHFISTLLSRLDVRIPESRISTFDELDKAVSPKSKARASDGRPAEKF